MLCGPAFEQAVLPHGTTAVITDPHEISNVAGTTGLNFMLETTRNLKLSVYFMLPSCVPSTDLDESGAVLEAKELAAYYRSERVLGLAELMNSYGTVNGEMCIRDSHQSLAVLPKGEQTLFIGVSGSGVVARVAEGLMRFRTKGVYAVAFSGDMQSKCARAAQAVSYTHLDEYNRANPV